MNDEIDINSVQIIFSTFQDLEKLKEEGEPKVADVVAHSEAVLPNTTAPGKDIVAREIEALQTDWSSFIILLVQVRYQIVFFHVHVRVLAKNK